MCLCFLFDVLLLRFELLFVVPFPGYGHENGGYVVQVPGPSVQRTTGQLSLPFTTTVFFFYNRHPNISEQHILRCCCSISIGCVMFQLPLMWKQAALRSFRNSTIYAQLRMIAAILFGASPRTRASLKINENSMSEVWCVLLFYNMCILMCTVMSSMTVYKTCWYLRDVLRMVLAFLGSHEERKHHPKSPQVSWCFSSCWGEEVPRKIPPQTSQPQSCWKTDPLRGWWKQQRSFNQAPRKNIRALTSRNVPSCQVTPRRCFCSMPLWVAIVYTILLILQNKQSYTKFKTYISIHVTLHQT